MLLFTVQDKFLIKGRGLVLFPGLGDKMAIVGDPIKIIKPDLTVIETKIRGVGFNEFRDILVGEELGKDDVPIGSEVWLNRK